MPTVNFVGQLESAAADNVSMLSVTWALVPGNRAWSVHAGQASGETQISASGVSGFAPLNHPLDVYYETSSSEGWPFLVCEVMSVSFAIVFNTLPKLFHVTLYAPLSPWGKNEPAFFFRFGTSQ